MAYNLLKPFKLLSATSMGANITSAAVEIALQDNIGIQLHWTGTPSGTFDVQISADHLQDMEGNIQVPGNWVSLALSPAIIASGAADDAYIDLNQMSARYVRLVYTRSAGTGSLDCTVMGKAV